MIVIERKTIITKNYASLGKVVYHTSFFITLHSEVL